MDTIKLERWAQLLLDTGKRNNLINYKDSKTSSVEVVYPDTETLFDKCTGSAVSLEVFDPKTDEDDEGQLTLNSLMEEDAPDSEHQNRESFISKYSPRIKRANQILVYAKCPNPITAVKNINKRAKSFMEETGVNVAHMAFGFVHWKESESSQFINRAPLLLVPITISNSSSISPFYINTSDEDVIVNPTFSYLMSAQFGISLPEYEDEGMIAYLSKVRGLVGKMGWNVSGECKISVFSFLKINMYHDLMNNKELILQNHNIQRLLGEKTIEENNDSFDAGERNKENDLIELHTVVDADSSQIDAIEMAKSGRSFVLQGPPGTGKSQTITNIIAECLFDGKKVLFVSEKQAALNVVFEKLKKAGLDEFCLELHSHKSNKKAVIDELCRTLEADRTRVSSRAYNEVEIKEKLQKKLDAYADELHKPIDVINMTMYQLYSACAACRKAPSVNFTIKGIEGKDERFLNECVNLLEQYVEYTHTIGKDFRHNPWYGYIGKISSSENLDQFKKRIEGTIQCLRSIDRIINEYSTKYGLSSDENDVKANQHLLKVLSELVYDTPDLLRINNLGNYKTLVEQLRELSVSILGYSRVLDESYDDRIYSLDAQDYYNRLLKQYASAFSRLVSTEYKGLITELKLHAKPGVKVTYTTAIKSMSDLLEHNRLVKEFEDKESEIRLLLGKAYRGIYTDWDKLLGEIEKIQHCREDHINFGTIASLSSEEYSKSKNEFGKIAGDLSKLMTILDQAKTIMQREYDETVVNFSLMSNSSMLAKTYECAQSIDQIENWIRFNVLLEQLRDRDLFPFVIQVINDETPTEYIPMSFKRRFYEQWIDHEIHSKAVFSDFTRVSQDKAVEQFAQKDKLQFDISKAQIRAVLSAKRPSLDLMATGSSVSVLLREGQKKRKQKPVRKLLEDIGDLVQVLKPCFLMSPLSVSTFLTNKALTFDTVVFDEASQIFPQDAVGAIYRCNQLIVVGDSKQMPPSNFFTSSIESENDEDEEIGDVTDFESLLDICATTMTQLRLRWHYRSKFEQLISFSNRNFYDNTLVTFPSAETKRKGLGVDYYGVNGTYDRKSHTNRDEAEYIVDLVYDNIDKYPDRSMGIVAFSVAQQDLIDRLLSKKRQEDSSREWYFSQEAMEPFFIKNLETVQGDERDTIIFSIAYGKDSQGRLLHNFGPLNKKGGERRLNVAVTRAKYNVQLVSSMHYTDIDLSKTSSDGAHLLRSYLDFAENGEIALERAVRINPFEEYDSEFEMDVCDFLRENGYTVDTQVGCSGFKIDLGLRRSEGSDYVLAIECDGATYHSSRNARDRDRLRQEILEGMGWRFYRIWSTDWFRNNTIEKNRLLKAAYEAINLGPATKINHSEQITNDTKSDENKKAEAAEDIKEEEKRIRQGDTVERKQINDRAKTGFEETVNNSPLQFPQYREVSIYANSPIVLLSRQDMVKRILETEAPLAEEYLLKRIVFLYGREKVTSTVKQQFRNEMRGCEKKGIKRNNGFLYLSDKTSYALRVPGVKRDIKYIAPEELAAGMYVLIKQNITIDKESLYRTLINHLGFNRMGDTVLKRLDQAFLLLDPVVIVTGDTVSLVPEK